MPLFVSFEKMAARVTRNVGDVLMQAADAIGLVDAQSGTVTRPYFASNYLLTDSDYINPVTVLQF